MHSLRHHQPRYLDLPLPVHADEPERRGPRTGHRHWLWIIGLILLAIFLIGVTVTGGTG
jgi:hypothetical protein